MRIEDCWPTLQPIYDQINQHFAKKDKTPFYLLAGREAGKTTLANVLMIERYTAGKSVALADISLNHGMLDSEHYSDNMRRPIRLIDTIPHFNESNAVSDVQNSLGDIVQDTLLVVESYEWIPYHKVDHIIDICIDKGADVLILSSRGIYADKKYKPTVCYSTWELNPVLIESDYLYRYNEYPTDFERDFGGGKPYPGR